jgi:hypothetical protein
LVEESAGTIKGKASAAEEHDGSSAEMVLAIQHHAQQILEVPLAQKLISKELQEEVQLECHYYSQQNGDKYSQYLAEEESNAQQVVEESSESAQDATKAETGKNRKIKKPISVAEGLRKKMAKAKIEKRLSEVGAGGDASSEIDLRDGVKNWDHEHRPMSAESMATEQTPTASAQPSTQHASSSATEQRSTGPDLPESLLNDMKHNEVLARGVDWYFNREKYKGKLPGHAKCKCSAAKHKEIEELMIKMVELRTDLGDTIQHKEMMQESLVARPASAQPNRSERRQAKAKENKAKSRARPDYDSTLSQYEDATSEKDGGFIDMET